MKNYTSKNNHCILMAFVFLLFCSGCGYKDEPAIDMESTTVSEPATYSEGKAIEALGGEVSFDESGNVDAVVFLTSRSLMQDSHTLKK